MKKFIYAAAAILLPTILGVLFGGIISEEKWFFRKL